MDRRRELEDVRRQMADADVEILQVLEKRARLARQAGELRGGATPTLPTHEQERLLELERMAGEQLPAGAVRSVFREIHAATLALEAPLRVAFVGPEGGLCQAAARRQFGPGAQLVLADSAAGAFDEVTRHRADYAVVPFESSLEGPVQPSILALTPTDLTIVAEIELEAALSLLSRTGNLRDIDKVYATTSDRAACQRFISQTLPKATMFDVRSPVVASQLAAEDHGGAAIVPQACSENDGLVVIQSNIGDQADLRIRFGVGATRPASRTGADTTAFVFSVHDAPGALFDVLKHFAERGINLKTIHSRPMPGERWNYLFYVEVDGHATDRPIVTALEAIKQKTRLLKVLGSFPTC